MVLCRYFQRNQCRFGAKCYKDHIDIRNTLKTDAEQALMGKQWPFTCYGPFKDKPCLPNYTNDLSFEEIRFLFHSAKENNTLAQYNAQLQTEAGETGKRIQALMEPSESTLEAAMELYDMADADPKTNATAKNPFSVAPAANIFPQSGAALGGFSAQTQNSTGSGFFTQPNNQAPPQQIQPSIFGQQAAQAAQTSIFSQPNNVSLFAQQPNAATAMNPFEQAQSMNASNQGFFAQSAPAAQPSVGFPSMIGSSQPSANLAMQQNQPAVQSNMFFQQQPAAPGFPQVAQQQQQPAPPTSFFSQPPNIQATPAQAPAGNFTGGPSPAAQSSTNAGDVDFNIYSRMEDLTPAELAAFNAAEFTPGNLPFSPPPFELVK